MDQIYHYIGFFFTWFFIVTCSALLIVGLPLVFWAWNSRSYTWLYQLWEVPKIYFTFRKKEIESNNLAAIKKMVTEDTRMIFQKWHLNFIAKKELENAKKAARLK